MKKIMLMLGILLFLIGCQPIQYVPSGTAVLGITDAQLGTVSSLNIKITSAILHNTNGQRVIVDVNKEYNLIDLGKNNIIAELGYLSLPEGTYNQLTLNIENVVGIVDSMVENIVLPSNSLKIPINLVVEANKTSAVVLDFIADESLHRTGEGKIIMTPVIDVQTKKDIRVVERTEKELILGLAVSEEAKRIGTDIKGIVSDNGKVTKEDIDNVVVDAVGKIREKTPAERKAKGATII